MGCSPANEEDMRTLRVGIYKPLSTFYVLIKLVLTTTSCGTMIHTLLDEETE